MPREKKSMRTSYTVKANIVLPADSNNIDTLFGGVLMKHIDEVAAISALRHCRTTTVTASNDGVHFHRPIKKGHIVCLESYVSSVGRTSMEVFVKIITENAKTGRREVAAVSFLTFVALDDDSNPVEIADVFPEGDEEKLVFAEREIRKEARIKKRGETNQLISALSAERR